MIMIGDCRQMLPTIEPESIDCIVTSPPYYNLRDYGMPGQIGAENTVEEYIDNLTDVFSKSRTVLKPNGTLWLNVADTYAQKNLLGIPWQLAFALRNDGWILRQDIIWCKPNPMPESVVDRCTKAHEYLFLLTKSAKYYFSLDSVKEEAQYKPSDSPKVKKSCRYGGKKYALNQDMFYRTKSGNIYNYTGTRHPRSVWTIPTQPFSGEHFATFPEELVRRCILAGCPPSGIVMDPFCGSGTTGKVAYDLGREFCGIELNPKYAEIATKRIGISRQMPLEMIV